ncbi:amino acid ABC transporter permease [Humibacillus sp. DSM 29435]|uniref:amino acid ABC transporter permease n=1 Tax=Humibacillus sp. DSM 29435 TaxID=1869167 RepID=UPI000871D5B8|nr:amino acid ABC transporter permease [Humibacillus sp. DSM 29435]OFE16485.1 amino acid ABC transporter permease [Humibacillus sp. DSM 29435]
MSSEIVLFDAPGPKARRRHAILTVVGIVIALAIAWLVLRKMGEANQLEKSLWTPFVTDPEVWTQYLLTGLWGTIKAAALSVVFAGIFGLVFGMGRLSGNRWISGLCGAVVEFFRSVPVLIMMVFAYFGYFATSDLVSASTAPLASVVLALTLYNGSVIAELVRSGVFSLPSGQREAGLSIGLSPSQTLRSIQLPQALTAMLPALVGQLVVVLKDTALGVVITYPELLNAAKTLGSAYANTVPAYIVAALIFIVINYALTRVAAAVERWLKSRGQGPQKAGPAGITAAAVAEAESASHGH